MSTEPQGPDDRELEDFMAGRGPVSREYSRLEKPAAPAQLDDAILRMAREAVRVKPRPAPRWRVPLALAATLLLGLSTTLLIHEERGVLAPEPVAQQDMAPLPPAAGQPQEAEIREAARMAESMSSLAGQKLKRAQPKPAKPRPPAPAAAAAGALMKEEQAAPAFAPAPMPAAPSVQRFEDAPAPPPSAPKALQQAPASVAPLMAEPERRAKRADSARQREEKDEISIDPETWLARVRALLAQNQPEEARRQLKAWTAAYPDRAVPDDLKSLLN